jgi:hypothetical protein
MKKIEILPQSIKLKYIYLLLIFSLILLNYVTQMVIYSNQFNGLYSSESDSISIPIYVILFLSALILIFNLLGMYMASKKWTRWIGVGLILISFMLILGSTMEWMLPNHYFIAVGHVPTLLICGYISIRCLLELIEINRTRIL